MSTYMQEHIQYSCYVSNPERPDLWERGQSSAWRHNGVSHSTQNRGAHTHAKTERYLTRKEWCTPGPPSTTPECYPCTNSVLINNIVSNCWLENVKSGHTVSVLLDEAEQNHRQASVCWLSLLTWAGWLLSRRVCMPLNKYISKQANAQIIAAATFFFCFQFDLNHMRQSAETSNSLIIAWGSLYPGWF